MIIRQLKQNQFEHLNKQLIKKAHAEPLEASYTVKMTISSVEYSIRIQPEEDCKIAVLQAFKIDRDEFGMDFELITNENILSALFEILVFQGVR